MMKRAALGIVLGIVLMNLGACELVDPQAPSIAGRYDLVTVNGVALPCCAQTDSNGANVTFVGGSLTLEQATPEPFAATPAGWRPGSCVHEIPNGANVDTSGVVTLPDGSQYRIPKCTELHHAAYTLVVTRRYDYADGSSKTLAATSNGTYAWSDGGQGWPKLIALLNSNLIGPVTSSPTGMGVTVYNDYLGRGPALTPSDPEYQFFRAMAQ